MEVTITYADYDKEIKKSTLLFEDLSEVVLSIKENIIETPMIPIGPSTPVGTPMIPIEPSTPMETSVIEDENIKKEKVLEIASQFLDSEVKIEMPYQDLLEYIAILQKIAKQIRPIQ